MSPQLSHGHDSTIAVLPQLQRAFLGQLGRLPERPNRATCFVNAQIPALLRYLGNASTLNTSVSLRAACQA